jgi:hypothetical protein
MPDTLAWATHSGEGGNTRVSFKTDSIVDISISPLASTGIVGQQYLECPDGSEIHWKPWAIPHKEQRIPF